MSEHQSAPITAKQSRLKYFVGRVGPSTTNLSLRTYFSSFGAVHIAKTEISKRSGKKKGFGYVIYEYLKHPDDLCNKEHILDGKLVSVARYEESVLTHWHHLREQCFHLQVVNIPQEVAEIEVVKAIEHFGKVLVSNCPRQLQDLPYLCNVEIQKSELLIHCLINTLIGLIITKETQKLSITFKQLGVTCAALTGRQQLTPTTLSFPKSDRRLHHTADVQYTVPVSSLEMCVNSPETTNLTHSKYEYISSGANYQATISHLNYRFNIVKPCAVDVALVNATFNKSQTISGVVMLKEQINKSKRPGRHTYV